MVYTISKEILKLIKLVFVKQIKGISNLPKGPFILAVNHSSYLDPALVYAVVLNKLDKKVHAIGAKYLFKKKLWDFIYRVWWESIPLNGAVEKAIKYLKKGEIVCIFPEGGRSRTGKMGKATGTGAAVMALETGAPVVPVHIKGTFELWPRYHTLPKLGRSIEITIGKPLKFTKKDNPSKKELNFALKKIMDTIKKLK
ncbi:MAG: lysophospholipid acyltransferase family protein [Candidatus Nanoarchaeia archaeon]|nr:lysophospholipid acyltransferase family protein [Candidatus Nanoarchaeia archaeon]